MKASELIEKLTEIMRVTGHDHRIAIRMDQDRRKHAFQIDGIERFQVSGLCDDIIIDCTAEMSRNK